MDKSRQEAFEALYKSYTKILKINLTKDSYHILKMNENEKTALKGFSNKISLWLIDFALSGQVYFDDLETYATNTNIDFLKNYFKNNDRSLSVRYRRLTNNEYHWVIMELIRAEEYTEDNQVLFLFVRDINDNYIAELEIQRELEQSCNTDGLTGLQNYYAFKTKCIRFSNFIKSGSVGVIFCDLNGLKIVNDTKGHSEGNIFITNFAKLLSRIFREEELFRLSGDEFAVILLAQDKDSAYEKFQKLKDEINKDELKVAAIGFGWADKTKKIEDVLNIAEERMYADKRDFYQNHSELKREIFEKKFSMETQAIINNLISSYPTVGIVNINSDDLKILKMDSLFPEAATLTKYSKYVKLFKTQYFSENTKKELEKFNGIETLKKYLLNQNSFELKFQIKNGEWREIVFSTLERYDDVPTKVLFYAQKLNSASAKDMERSSKIKAEYEILEGISSDFTLISLIDFKSGRFNVYKNKNLPDALVEQLKNKTFNETKKWFVETYIEEDERDDFIKSITIENITEHLKNHQSFTYLAHTTPEFHNTKEKTLSSFMFYKPIEGRNNIAFATKIVTTKQSNL